MTIVGFSFKKINVERNEVSKGKISIKNNTGITNVEAFNIGKKEGLKFECEYVATYEVGKETMAKINIIGEVLAMEKPDVVKAALATWKKNNKMKGELLASVLNTTLAKCHVEALMLSRDFNLPSPVQLPKVTVSKKS